MSLPNLGLDTILICLNTLNSLDPLVMSEESRRSRVIRETPREEEECDKGESRDGDHQSLPLVGRGFGICVIYAK